MKLRCIEVEGTPEECERFSFARALGADGVAPVVTPKSTVNSNGKNALPDGVSELTTQATNPAARELAEQFVREVLSFGGNVQVRRGKNSKREDGLANHFQFRKVGSRYGAFAYFNPIKQRLLLRLSDVPKGFKFAITRNVQAKDPYKIAMFLTSKDAVEESVKLSRLAYDAT